MMKKLFGLLLVLCALSAHASVKAPGNSTSSSTLPPNFITQNVACTNGATGSVDAALLAQAVANGGGITLQGNCTVNALTTLNSNTTLNLNGYTVTAAAAANWSGSAIGGFVNAASNANYITVENGNLVWTGASAGIHIISFSANNTHVKVLGVWSTGAGDLVATVGTTDALSQGNTCLNSSNSCYDHWGGATDIKDIGNYASMATGATGAACFQFTGFNTDSTVAATTGYTALGNTCYVNANVQIPININGFAGSCSGAKDDQDVIADNRIYVAAGIEGPGIRFSGCGNYAEVHDNLIFADGATSSSYPAIEVQSSWTGVQIHNNLAWGWLAPTTGSDDGEFHNAGANGSIINNACLGTCGALLLSLNNATSTQIAGNSFGTADFTFTSAAGGTAMLVGQNTGNLGHNDTANFLAPNITGGNEATRFLGQAITTGNSVQEEFSWTGNNNGANFWAMSMAGTGVDFIKFLYFPDTLTLGDGGTAVNLNGATTFLGNHAYSGTAPTVACGTGANGTVDAHATATSGTLTSGTTSVAACTLTFAAAYATWVHCSVTAQTAADLTGYSYTTSVITLTGASVSQKYDYRCDGR